MLVPDDKGGDASRLGGAEHDGGLCRTWRLLIPAGGQFGRDPPRTGRAGTGSSRGMNRDERERGLV